MLHHVRTERVEVSFRRTFRFAPGIRVYNRYRFHLLRKTSVVHGIVKCSHSSAPASVDFCPRCFAVPAAASTTFSMVSLRHPTLTRSITTTAARFIGEGWLGKIKGAITGKPKAKSFTLSDFADQMDKAREMRSFKDYAVGRASETTVSLAFERQAEILRYLGAIDPSGESLQSTQKQAAAKHCNCSLADVEHALSKYTWAKDAQNKLEKLKEEGKPMPQTFAEVQKMMGSSPLDVAKNNLERSGRISKNALCPCGSNKKYKRCCGTAIW